MARTLLRSGSLDDYQAMGENGQSVFNAALQIREALRLRQLPALTDCLAIPQINDAGDRVDWYAPFSGRVCGWLTADDASRTRALDSLTAAADSASALAACCMQSGSAAQMRFGALLAKALRFPGINHVYLVDGKPVITFWGFASLNDTSGDDALACLAQSCQPVPEPETAAKTGPCKPLTDWSLSTVLVAPAPTPSGAPLSPDRRARFGLIPLAAIAAAALIVALPSGWLLLNRADASPSASPPQAPALTVPEPVDWPILTTVLPLRPAEVVPPEPPPPIVPVAAPAAPPNAPPPHSLVMDASQVRAGTTRFLNGNWRVEVDIRDPLVGKMPPLHYRIDNNKGMVQVTLRGNVTCKTGVFSGLHRDGSLAIKSRGAARCSNGTRFSLPQIVCKPGSGGAASCTGRYDEATLAPVTLTKVSS